MKPYIFSFILFNSLILLLWLANFKRDKRYQQWWSPVTALVFSIWVIWFCHKYGFYAETAIIMLHNKLRQTILAPYLPFHEQGAFLVYFNFLILLSFLIVKKTASFISDDLTTLATSLWRWIIKTLFEKDKGRFILDEERHKELIISVAYCYDMERKGITLRDEWVYPATFMRYMAGFASLLLIMLLMAAILGMAEKPIYIPRLPAMSLLILCEIAWYLGGLRRPRKEVKIEGRDSVSTTQGSCQNLWEKYMAVDKWKERILAASLNIDNGKFPGFQSPGPSSPNPDLKPEMKTELEVVNRNLASQGFQLDSNQSEILEELWKGEDVLISEAIYEKAVPVVFAALQRDIFEGYKIIFLTHSTKNGEIPDDLTQWIHKWLDVQIFSGKNFQVSNIKKFRGLENVLVTSVRDLLKYNMKANQDWFRQVRTVVVVHIPETMFDDITSATALFQILADQSEHTLQMILLTTEERKNLEPSVREYLASTPREFHLFSPLPQDICYIIWRSEGRTAFQSAILQGTSRYYSTEMILAVPALRDNTDRICLTGVEQKPWQEYVEEMSKVADPACKKARSAVSYLPLPYISDSEERAFVIAYDKDCNLVTTLIKSLAFGRKGIFVHVVSQAYLLRDYFADNMDFFIRRRPESAGTLAPTLMREPSTVASYLRERLLATELTEEEITRHINRIEYSPVSGEYAVEDRLIRLFRSVFGKDLRDRLTVRTDEILDPRQKHFRKITRLKLKQDIRQLLPGIGSDNYFVYDPGEKPLQIIPGDHVYQNYLPYQVHAFQGNLFKIKAVDDHARCVITENVTPEGTPIYRHINSLDLKQATPFHESVVRTTRKNHIITQTLYMADFEIKTSGYFVFMNGIDLSEWPETTDLTRHNIPSRKYGKGRMTGFEIKNKDRSPYPEYALVSFTLALILNEVFVTAFPETHQYLIAATPCEHGYAGENSPALEIFKFVPKLKYPETLVPGDSDSVSLYVFEDSATDMGLAKAVYDNWEYLFMIIEDCLAWFMEKNDTEKGFLTYGLGFVPEFLKLGETTELLFNLVGDRPMNIRKSREAFDAAPGLSDDSAEQRLCDFCGEPLSSMGYEQLADGRERCETCRKSAVDTLDELKKIYRDARKWMAEEFRLEKFRQNIYVKFTDAGTIQEITGKTFVPTSGFDPREVGVSVKEGSDYSVYLENGQPYHMTLAGIVHELTHIWQFDNLNYKKMKKEHGLLLTEGHAVWTEIRCLKHKGVGVRYCDIQASGKDEYGKGFKMIERLLRESGSVNPFVLLKKKYPL